MSENKQTETTNHRSLYLALFVFLTLITNHLPLLFGTTVTGKLLDPQGNAITNGHARFLLMNYGIGNLPRVQGTFLIVNVTPIDVLAAADGTFSAMIQGNDAITPLGTTYQVTLYAGGQVYLSANYSITGSTFDLNTATPASAVPAVPPAQAYTTVDSVGVPVTQRQILNFLGSGVTCADNSSVSRTDCTITGGGGGGATFQANGTNTSSQQTINWQSGTNITISNPSAGNVRFDFSGSLPIASGGTGQTTAGAAFNALSPMTTLGDVTYGGASGAGTRLGGNTTTTKQFLSQTGTGTASAPPAWTQPAFADLSGLATKAQLPGTTVYTDQANTFGAFLQKLQAGANFQLADPTDTTKLAQFDLSGITTGTTRTVTVANAASATVIADTGAANNFLTAISAGGVISKAQPSFANLSGSIALSQTVLTTRGDLLTANATPSLARLGLGTVNQFLGVSGSDPGWSLPFGASTASVPSFAIPAGTAPTTPTKGWVWAIDPGSNKDLQFNLADNSNGFTSLFGHMITVARTYYVCTKASGGTCVYNGDAGTVAPTIAATNDCATKATPCPTAQDVFDKIGPNAILAAVITIQVATNPDTGTDCIRESVIVSTPAIGGMPSVMAVAEFAETDQYPLGYFLIQGDTTTPNNVVIDGGASCGSTTPTLLHFVEARNGAHVLVKGVNFRYFKADAVFATGAGSLGIIETDNGTNSGAFVGAMIGVTDHAQGRAGGTFTHTNFTLVRTGTSGVFGSHTPLGYVTDNCTITASAAGGGCVETDGPSTLMLQGGTWNFHNSVAGVASVIALAGWVFFPNDNGSTTIVSDTAGGILEKASLNGSVMDRCGMAGFTCTLTNLTQRYIADGAGSSVTIGDNQQGSTVSRPTNGATASVNNNTGTKISYASVQEMNPGSDSTTAIKITNAAGSLCSETIDTTNQRVRFGDCSAPSTSIGAGIDIVGSMKLGVGALVVENSGTPAGAAGIGFVIDSSEDHLFYQNLNNGGAQPFGVRGILTSTYTNATTTASNITGLSFTVAASRNYVMDCTLFYQGSATTAGLDVTITGPASPTSVFYSLDEYVTATTVKESVASAFATKLVSTTITATTNFTAYVKMGLRNGTTAGTVQVQGSATGTGTVTVQAGSYCTME